MTSPALVWGILLLPLGAFVVNALIVRPFFNRSASAAGYIAVAAIGGAFVLSLLAFQAVIERHEPLHGTLYTWSLVDGLSVEIGYLLDSLTAVMLLAATGVSFMVQVYSTGYMKGDPGYARYYAYMCLFTASMVGLVLASNLIQLFIFWELVGLCSFLLIGFWYHRPAAANAAKKAFLVTRLGDFGFLLGILYLFAHRAPFEAQGLNVLDIADIQQGVRAGLLAVSVLTWVGLGLFAGAVGKSAQFPLHIWLPDAMEGPTPVSALIHAATMVAAGVFLVARFYPIYEASETARNVVALIGAFTALFAATMGLVSNDIKRVLAYSTISQLGYMVAALGIGAYSAAMFHLFTHAFFKALLFLGAGSVSHAVGGTFNMRYMGGLRRVMPATYWTFVIGALSLAGVFPLAGFWSKDEILTEALHGGATIDLLVLALLLAGVVLTAFYTFRAVFMTFHGSFRGGVVAEDRDTPAPTVVPAAAHTSSHDTHAVAAQKDAHGEVHMAESPPSMVIPLAVLAVPAAIIGFLVQPPFDIGVPAYWLGHFLTGAASSSVPETAEEVAFNLPLAGISFALALAGIGAAWAKYGSGRIADRDAPRSSLYTFASRKYYMDEIAERGISTRFYYGGVARFARYVDAAWVDGMVDGVGWLARNIGRLVGRLQTGQTQTAAAAFSVGIIVILVAYLATRGT